MSAGDAIDIAGCVRAGRCKAADIVREALKRIERDDREVNSFVTVNAEAALAAAEDVDRKVARGVDPGQLAGVPIGVKDNEGVAAMPTKHGSLVHANAAPE